MNEKIKNGIGKIASSVKNIFKAKDMLKSAVDYIKRNKMGAIAIAIVTTVACIVIIPSIVSCIENNAITNCRTHIYRINIALNEMLRIETAQGGDYLQRTIEEGDMNTVISLVNSVTPDRAKFNESDYYIVRNDDKLEIRCKKHDNIKNIGTLLSSVPGISTDFSAHATDGKIVLITVSGPSKYRVNEAFDASDLTKMKFTGDEVNYLINNLTVTAQYLDGSSAQLGRGDYTITCDELDMGVPGSYVLNVRAKSKSVWSNFAYATFVLDVYGEDDAAPFIIEVQNAGRYELAAQDWAEFVTEAKENGGAAFGASIVRWNGKYYYYPDGFTIDISKPDTDPFLYAHETNGGEKNAYYIEFDMDSIIINQNDKPHNGSVRVENDLVYIWQEKPSKELPAGWIRVDCEIQKY